MQLFKHSLNSQCFIQEQICPLAFDNGNGTHLGAEGLVSIITMVAVAAWAAAVAAAGPDYKWAVQVVTRHPYCSPFVVHLVQMVLQSLQGPYCTYLQGLSLGHMSTQAVWVCHSEFGLIDYKTKNKKNQHIQLNYQMWWVLHLAL